MKHLSARPLLLIVVLACWLTGKIQSAETLRFRADTWMPVNGDATSDQPGYAVEVLRAIFTKQGIMVDYQTMPWPDALRAADDGTVDGVIGASRKEASRLILPEEVIGVARFGLYVRQANPWTFSGLGSLQGVRLGAIDGYAYWEALDEYVQTHHAPDVVLFTGETPLKDGLAMLSNGAIDVMSENVSVFTWAARNEWLQPSAFRLAYVHPGDDAFVAFARGNAGRRNARLFDKGIRQLRLSGELSRILAKYGVEDWK